MPKPPSTWKNLERFVAKFLNGERTHWALEDVRAGNLAVECKHGKQIPKTLLKWWEQAVRNAKKATPVLVLHPLRWPMTDSLVVIELTEYKRLLDADNSE